VTLDHPGRLSSHGPFECPSGGDVAVEVTEDMMLWDHSPLGEIEAVSETYVQILGVQVCITGSQANPKKPVKGFTFRLG